MISPCERMLRYFDAAHLPDDLRHISKPFGTLARDLVDALPASPELTAGLRKLLEAKDCCVRAAVDAREGKEQ